MTHAWWNTPLSRYQPPPIRARPGGEVCWCHPPGQPVTGREYKPGWFEHEHPEGLVRWYAGTAPLRLSGTARP